MPLLSKMGSVAVNNDELVIKLKKQIDLLTNNLTILIDQEINY